MRAVVPVIAILVALAGCSAPERVEPASTAPLVERVESSESAAPLAPITPAAVRIPRIGAESSLVRLGLAADGTVEVPPVSTPMQAGWYENGPPPGEIGPAVILGHVDGDKRPGIFFRLRELAPGDQILVDNTDGTTSTFVATRVEKVAKSAFPTDAVYGDTDSAELRVITCGGVFDRNAKSYEDNIIVYATLA